MSRPARIRIRPLALRHNLEVVKQYAPRSKVIAMVKANAYGFGLNNVLSVLDGHVDAFGVASIEEALAVRALSQTDCIIFQGLFTADELQFLERFDLQSVIHSERQLKWILTTSCQKPLKIWVKVNTGMNRLGFFPHEVHDVMTALSACPWINKNIGLLTHFACADDPDHEANQTQFQLFNRVALPNINLIRSSANSAAIMRFPSSHLDAVRPGIMLYGASPIAGQTATDIGLMPVMQFTSAITAIHDFPAYAKVGYGGTWHQDKPSRIGLVTVGYGDGYPRHISPGTPTWVNQQIAPIVGRVSMDMLTIDLSQCHDVKEGDEVELWGPNIPVETIAKSAGTIAYELFCQITQRVRGE